MADLRVVYSEIEGLIGTVNGLLSKYDESIQGVTNVQQAVANGALMGPVADALNDKLNTITGNMKNYASVMSHLKDALNKAAQELQAKDQETVGKIPQSS
jgi:uncharacterized protein YukE